MKDSSENLRSFKNVTLSWASFQNAIIKPASAAMRPTQVDQTLDPDDLISFPIPPEARKYNPFDYYHNPVPDNVVSDILGKRENPQPVTLYTLFASLDPRNHEQLLKWIYHFGVPRFMYQHPQVAGECDDSFPLVDDLTNVAKAQAYARDVFVDLAPLAFIQDDIEAFATIIQLSTFQYRSIQFGSADHPVKRSLLRGPYYPNPYGIQPESQDQVKINAGIDAMLDNENMVIYFNRFLEGVHPVLRHDGEYTLTWNFPSLLSAMYFMLALDLKDNITPTQCSNHLCGRYFVAKRKRALYCSDTCQNRAKQQRHREKKALRNLAQTNE